MFIVFCSLSNDTLSFAEVM